MKNFLMFLFHSARARFAAIPYHDDTLRANQGGGEPAFGPWRALVGR